jgi:DNA repair protein RadC
MIILQDITLHVCEPGPLATILRTWLLNLDETDRQKEHFLAILLNARSYIQIVDVISIGTVNASLVHPRETFIRAIKASAAQIIIAHNHPSGRCEPSDADMQITKRLVSAGELLGIEVIDHIIFSTTAYLSFRKTSLL